MGKPSVIFMGSKPGSVVALTHLHEQGWNIRAVCVSGTISHPWYPEPDLKTAAKSLGVPVVKQGELTTLVDDVDVVISYMFRHLVKPEIASKAKCAAVNFHAAPLPEYGGWGTYNLAILENKKEFGCTCHHLGEGFDDGPLLKVRRFPIEPDILTGFALEQLAQREMISLFKEFVEMIEHGEELPSDAQPKHQVRYHSLDEFLPMKKIPEGADQITIDRYARAFWFPPYEGAYFEQNGTKFEVVPQVAREAMAGHLCADVLTDLFEQLRREDADQ
ncbi:formyltransferase family protein [Maritalea sp. S77]|uniref:formyltransferase family protein n=1 Tax=Maritalea sp. S77 TaxID=3415125 RepID=UPI003C7CA221